MGQDGAAHRQPGAKSVKRSGKSVALVMAFFVTPLSGPSWATSDLLRNRRRFGRRRRRGSLLSGSSVRVQEIMSLRGNSFVVSDCKTYLRRHRLLAKPPQINGAGAANEIATANLSMVELVARRVWANELMRGCRGRDGGAGWRRAR